MGELIGKFRRKCRAVADTYRRNGAGAASAKISRGLARRVPDVWIFINECTTDRKYGVNTRGLDLSHNDLEAGIQGYQPSRAKHFSRALAKLPIDRSSFTFVDLGCGKGAVLFLAADAGFRRVIGVELVEELLESARINVQAFEMRRTEAAGRIELVLEDAACYELPAEPTVLFLFNPFGEGTLRSALARVEATLKARQHPIFLISSFMPPPLEEILANCPALQIHLTGTKLAIYRSIS